MYADVFAMGLVDLFGTASYGVTVIIVGVGEVEAMAVIGWEGKGVEKGAFIDTDAGVIVVGVEI